MLCPEPVFRISCFGRSKILHGNGIRLMSSLGIKATTSPTITS